jgi:hypothetical protein
MGNVIPEHRSKPTTPNSKLDRCVTCDDECEGDQCVGPSESLAGSREVLQTL